MATLLIDCDYNSTFVVGPDIRDTTGSMQIGPVTGPAYLRCTFRFSLEDLPAGATITLAEVRLTQWQNSSVAARSWWYGPYGTDGSDDPESDNEATEKTKTDLSSTNYLTTTIHRADANTDVDITSGGGLHIAAAAGNTYSVVIADVDESGDADHWFKVYGQDQAGELTPPQHIPQLYLEYTEAAAPATQNFFFFWRWR